MPRKRYRPEEIIAKLRQAEVLIERWRLEYNHLRPIWSSNDAVTSGVMANSPSGVLMVCS